MSLQPEGWYCFALKGEAQPFVKRARNDNRRPAVLVSGIGRRNAARVLRDRLDRSGQAPPWVVTCGLAGGLKPGLPSGTILVSRDSAFAVLEPLRSSLVLDATFLESDRVVVTAEEKQRLHQATGADAIEMESTVIRTICSDLGIPSATVRVILDTAEEDLPIDFNQYFRNGWRLDWMRLAGSLVRCPRRAWALIDLQRRSGQCARQLAGALDMIRRTVS